jgi:hypothetical protein
MNNNVHKVVLDNIKCAKYRILTKVYDVTEQLIKTLNERKEFKVSNNFQTNNIYNNKQSILTIFFNDNTKIHALYGSTISISTDINVEIEKINTNILSIPSKNNYILSTNVRDENNILEWIIYHLLLGFDKIVIIDHKSIIPIIKIIQPYEWKKKIYVIRREDNGPVKMKFLNEIIVPYMITNCNKYFIHLDADEYIYIKEEKVDTFLDKFNADTFISCWDNQVKEEELGKGENLNLKKMINLYNPTAYDEEIYNDEIEKKFTSEKYLKIFGEMSRQCAGLRRPPRAVRADAACRSFRRHRP